VWFCFDVIDADFTVAFSACWIVEVTQRENIKKIYGFLVFSSGLLKPLHWLLSNSLGLGPIFNFLVISSMNILRTVTELDTLNRKSVCLNLLNSRVFVCSGGHLAGGRGVSAVVARAARQRVYSREQSAFLVACDNCGFLPDSVARLRKGRRHPHACSASQRSTQCAAKPVPIYGE
jgi:hypothetical protein